MFTNPIAQILISITILICGILLMIAIVYVLIKKVFKIPLPWGDIEVGEKDKKVIFEDRYELAKIINQVVVYSIELAELRKRTNLVDAMMNYTNEKFSEYEEDCCSRFCDLAKIRFNDSLELDMLLSRTFNIVKIIIDRLVIKNRKFFESDIYYKALIEGGSAWTDINEAEMKRNKQEVLKLIDIFFLNNDKINQNTFVEVIEHDILNSGKTLYQIGSYAKRLLEKNEIRIEEIKEILNKLMNGNINVKLNIIEN